MARLARCTLVLAGSTMFAAFPSSAGAQEVATAPVPLVEVSAGYTFVRDTSRSEGFPAGWYFSGGVNLTHWFALVGEAGGSYRSHDTTVGPVNLQLSEKTRLYTFMGGPRFFHKAGRVVPFGQALVGVEHRRFEQTEVRSAGPMTGGNTWSPPGSTNLAIQPGGGLTVYLTDSIGIRAALDYRCVLDIDDDDVRNEFRFSSGFTFGWGRR